MPLQIRRGTTAERTSITPLAGELIYDTTERAVYVGDGATAGGVGVTAFTVDLAQDAINSLLQAGTHTGISFSYNDSLNSLSLTVGGGPVNLDIKGSVFADNSTMLVDSVLGSFNLDGTVKSDIVPAVDSTYDLGSPSSKFKDLYLSGSTLYLGNATITSTGSAVNLPAGSTVGGVPIGAGSGDGIIPGSNYNLNIIGDDSTIIVNSATKTVTAAGGFNGNLTGNVNGNVTGTVSGNIFTTLIDSADSSAITVTPAVIFSSDVTVDNEINAKNISVIGSITVGDGTENIRLLGRADGPVIQSLGEELVLESNASIGPQVRLNLKSGSTTAGSILSGVATSQQLDLRSYKNGATATNPGDIAAGDILGAISFTGIMSSTTSAISCAMGVQADPNGTLTSTHIPSKFFFLAQAATSGGGFKFMTFDSQGRLAINQETASATLDVNGFAKLAVLSAAPASPANGMVAIADGSGWDPAGTGKSVMVVYLAGGWRVSATAP